MANAIDASNAYLNTVRNLQNAGAGGASSDNEAGSGSVFGDLVKTGLQSAIDSQHQSEKISAQAVVGQADMTQVLQAVNDAEVALNTVLALRDKVVQAYNEILRTPI